jgi:hypothetical protein
VFTARYALSPYIKQIRFVFKGLMDFSQSALFFSLLPVFNSVSINICVYTVPPSVVWLSSQSTFLVIIIGYLTYSSLTKTNAIQPTYSDKINIFRSPNCRTHSLLCRFHQFSFTLIPQTFFLKLLFQKQPVV